MDNMIKFTVSFGMNIDSTASVSDQAFERFCQFYIDPRLQGYTLVSGRGIWNGTIEACKILEVLVPTGAQSFEIGHKLADIAKCYNEQFDQDCCMLTRQEVQAWFV